MSQWRVKTKSNISQSVSPRLFFYIKSSGSRHYAAISVGLQTPCWFINMFMRDWVIWIWYVRYFNLYNGPDEGSQPKCIGLPIKLFPNTWSVAIVFTSDDFLPSLCSLGVWSFGFLQPTCGYVAASSSPSQAFFSGSCFGHWWGICTWEI